MRHGSAPMKEFSPSEVKGILTSRHDVFAILTDEDGMFGHMRSPLTARLGETTYL